MLRVGERSNRAKARPQLFGPGVGRDYDRHVELAVGGRRRVSKGVSLDGNRWCISAAHFSSLGGDWCGTPEKLCEMRITSTHGAASRRAKYVCRLRYPQ